MKPIIGLTSQFEYSVSRKFNKLNYTYIDAVVKGGGVPIIIPILKNLDDLDKYLDSVDGIIFTGGEDISPLLFGEDPTKEVDTICYDRDKIELELFKRAYSRGMPILGICRGLQLINVALGGTLYQDINSQLPNSLGHISTYNIEGGYHSIDIINDTILYDILGKEKINVNSQHHQSVKELGKNLRVNALSSDGVIEGIETTTGNFVLGVQFHPEAMIEEAKEFINIFEYFILYCL
jgi:putative glutamine amidotransferase